MSRILSILLILSISTFSSNITIKDSHSSYQDFEIDFYQDKTKKLGLKKIQNIKEFQKITNKVALGKQEGNIWYHFSIKNETEMMQKRVLFITEPTLYDVEVFIIADKKIIATQTVGQNIYDKNGKIASFYPELEINFNAWKKIDIYIKSTTPFNHTFKVIVTTNKDLLEHKIFKNSLLYLYFGAIGALLLYNLFLYFSIRDKNYLIYIGFVFFYLLAQVQLSTTFNSLFTSKEITFLIATAHIFWVAFHILFSIRLLNIIEYFPRLNKFLLYTSYFLFAVGIFGLYDLGTAIQIIHPFMIVLPFVLISMAIMLYLKKNKIAIFYIIAQTLFLTSSLIFGLLFAGVLEYNNFTRYINFFGSFSEIILFSFALAYKTRLVIQENQEQKKLVDEYSKLSFLGQTIINIYHQWKSPVNNIYNSINHIEVAKEFNDKDIDKIIDENISQIKHNTQYLKETALNYLAHYKDSDNPAEKINLYNEIYSVVKLLKLESEKTNLNITINSSKNIELFLRKNHLTNLLMILLENAINSFKLRKIRNPILEISVLKRENKVILKIQDNAGGIKEKNINSIFERHHSSSSSTGLGLFLAKEFLISKLNAEIHVSNVDEGAEFTVIL